MLRVCSIFFLYGAYCVRIDPGPAFIPTKGEVWPKPMQKEKLGGSLIFSPDSFCFEIVNKSCAILEDGTRRYTSLIHNTGAKTSSLFQINSLKINLKTPCNDNEYPSENSDESYMIKISLNETILEANSIWGILRGLETFSQLIYKSENELRIDNQIIYDKPRYSFRGLMLDTARHFISVENILILLDAMAYNKLNVFQWHISDDQSFSFQSMRFPQLSQQGAFHPTLAVYSIETVKMVVEYARLRGIQVIPEFDSPGHTKSWGEGIPELLTPCFKDSEQLDYSLLINPTLNFTYEFFLSFFEEVKEVFNNPLLHVGGDEVDYFFTCWDNNPSIAEFKAQNNLPSNIALANYFTEKIINITNYLNMSPIVWEEVYVNGAKLAPNTIVQVWKNDTTIKNVTEDGYRAILSSCWYLDKLSTGGDWLKFYYCDPSKSGTRNEDLVLGGAAAMWAEYVTDENVMSRIWPRACAAAEKLWSFDTDISDVPVKDTLYLLYFETITAEIKALAERLEEHSCRMLKRGIKGQSANGPSFCY